MDEAPPLSFEQDAEQAGDVESVREGGVVQEVCGDDGGILYFDEIEKMKATEARV